MARIICGDCNKAVYTTMWQHIKEYHPKILKRWNPQMLD